MSLKFNFLLSLKYLYLSAIIVLNKKNPQINITRQNTLHSEHAKIVFILD